MSELNTPSAARFVPSPALAFVEAAVVGSAEAETKCRHYAKPDDNGCLVWQSYTRAGYGYVLFNGRKWRVHRLMYLAVNGAIPDGMIVCHRCNVRACCNPEHLYAGTDADNLADAIRAGRARNPLAERMSARTHCANGHALDSGNTVLRRRANRPTAHRICATCERERKRARLLREKMARASRKSSLGTPSATEASR